MKKLFAVTAAVLGFATMAQAGVHFSIGIGFPAPVIVAPAPIYAPVPVVVAPQPVCVPPRVYVAPAPRPVYYAPAPYYVPAPVVVCPAPVVVAAPVVYPRPLVYVGFGGGWRGVGGPHHYGHWR